MVDALVPRSGLSRSDGEEFSAWVIERLIDHDYALVRKCGDKFELKPYVSSMLAHLLCDFRNKRWGRWRPSAAARRFGPVAVQLEQLLVRDGTSLREATEILVARDPTLDRRSVAELARRLPRRIPALEVSLDDIEAESLHDETPSPDLDGLGRIVRRAVRDALRQLTLEDQVITKMRFWDKMSVADIARSLQLEQKPLYRRLEHVQHLLQDALQRSGVGADEVRIVLQDGLAHDDDPVFGAGEAGANGAWERGGRTE